MLTPLKPGSETMLILVAGSNTRNVADKVRQYGLGKLYSFFNERTLIESWDDDYFLMVDSGAHTWNKDTITKVGMTRKTKLKPASEFIKTYWHFFVQHCHKKLVFVEFDVYGHLPVQVIDNFYKSAMALPNRKAKLIRVYHPMLDGGTLDTLKKWIDDGHEYVGVGNDSFDANLLDKIFYLTQDKVRIHGFAMTKLGLMEKYPFFSVDSTSPLATVIFGRYSTPIMAMKERSDVVAEKSIECFHDDYERIENAVIEVARTQDYITKLWELKNVTWKELNY